MESEYANCLVHEYLTSVNKKIAKMFKKHKRLTEELPPGSPTIADVVKHFTDTARVEENGESSDLKKKDRKRKRNETESEEKIEENASNSNRLLSTEGRKIFIKNLGKKFVYEDFKEKVEKFGEVTKFLNSGRGYCFLTFSTAAAAAACIAALNNTKVAGKTLQMNIAKEKPAPVAALFSTPTTTPAKDTFAKRVEGCTLFVNGVKQKTPNSSLKEVFEQHGSVTECMNAGKGYAFVTFSTPGEASTAMEALNGTDVCGTNVSIEVSQKGGKSLASKKEVVRETVRLFVNNVNKDASKEDIKSVFSAHGTVTDVQHYGKGFAFVSFASAGSAQAAVKALHGQIWPKFCVKEIECNIANVQKGRKRRKKSSKTASE